MQAVALRGLAGIALILPFAGCKPEPAALAQAQPLSRAERATISGSIGFVSERSSEVSGKDVWLITPSGQSRPLTTSPEDEFPAAVAPDGSYVAVVATHEKAGVHREQLRLVSIADGVTRPLTRARGRARNPSWSPDGAWLVIESDERGFSDLVRLDLDAPPRDNSATNSEASDNSAANSEASDNSAANSEAADTEAADTEAAANSTAHGYTADNSAVAILTDGATDNSAVAIPTDGATDNSADLHEITLANAAEGNFEPSVSPNGRQIAFVSSRDGDPEIYTISRDGSDLTRITAFHREDWAPRWSPDGRWIAFLSTREGRARWFIVRPDGSDIRALSGSAATGDERDAAWSPSGDRIAFTGRQADGTTRIWMASITDQRVIPLTDITSRNDQPAWSPDGRYLVFVSERTGDPELFLMRADGSSPTQLTNSPGADWLPRWIPSPLPP